MKAPSRISSIVIWSVISAAFIGPGTVTTAVSVGASYKYDLLWALMFATLACVVLQELSARIVIATGLSLGGVIKQKYGPSRGLLIQVVIGVSVIGGCAAYEAGNILGAVSGIQLLASADARTLTILLCAAAFLILWAGGKKWISQTMLVLVVMMGVAFVALASARELSWGSVILKTVTPTIPPGSELLILGLIGTTIVPYNIFLGSGISHGQTVSLMRTGLIISVCIGGAITAAIVFAGATIDTFTTFPALADVLASRVGAWGSTALGLGLFAAGFSSAVTSPYASSVIATTVFEIKNKNAVRAIWSAVLLTGFLFGISGVKPVPVILTVQAVNGFLLPLLVLFLTLVANDHRLMRKEFQHAAWYNVVLLLILSVVFVIGLGNADRVLAPLAGFESGNYTVITGITGIIVLLTAWRIYQERKKL